MHAISGARSSSELGSRLSTHSPPGVSIKIASCGPPIRFTSRCCHCCHKSRPAAAEAFVDVVNQVGDEQVRSTMAQCSCERRDLLSRHRENDEARSGSIMRILLEPLLNLCISVSIVRLLASDQHVRARVGQPSIGRSSKIADHLGVRESDNIERGRKCTCARQRARTWRPRPHHSGLAYELTSLSPTIPGETLMCWRTASK